jgi:hypothetical protein
MSLTHIHLGNDLEDFPLTKNGNPKVGRFDYQYELLTPDNYYLVDDIPYNGEYMIAVHAEVYSEAPCPIIMYGTSLGVSTYGDKIYEIDVNSLTAIELFNTGLSPSSKNGPNGNAYDPDNNWLYYSAYINPDKLYFYDFTNPVNNYAGQISGQVACAGWYNGEYYYIPQNTGKLYKVTFNPDGTILTNTLIQTYAGKSFNFGDVVINQNGLMYGSSTVNGVAKFWSIDLMNSYLYTEISLMSHMQLAFGSDGELYGHDAGNANFYTIDYIAGTRTLVGSIGGLKFTDLASGPYEPCSPEYETAWSEGTEFPGNSWAMYFTYELAEDLSKTKQHQFVKLFETLLDKIATILKNLRVV